MTQPESRLSRKIMTELRSLGHFCFKVHGSEHMMAGLPDIIVCANGYFIGLETKMPGEEDSATPRQLYVHSLIRDAGGAAQIVTSVEEAVAVVKRIAVDKS